MYMVSAHSNVRNTNWFKYLKQKKFNTGIDYTENGRAVKTTGDDSKATQRLITARSHYYSWTGAQNGVVLSELRDPDQLAGLFCR